MIGVELGQFAKDPFGSGVQRVLQQLARHWPNDVEVEFLVPSGDNFGALSSQSAYELLCTTFRNRPEDHEAPALIADRVQELGPVAVDADELTHRYSSWLMPEMTYDPGILKRLRAMSAQLPLVMIGYDALPMSHPENYHFTPGTHAHVSEYLRILRDAPTVVCISDFTRHQLFEVLRRDGGKTTEVAHPGGDHVAVTSRPDLPVRPMFLRVGTMETRKHPVEIVATFTAAVDEGLEADLVFVGSPSRVDAAINMAVERAVRQGYPVRWIMNATDDDVIDWMGKSSAFMSYGVEGYGIPVLEAIRRGVPVIFDGVQPAAEIMEGRGALRMPLSTDPQRWHEAAEYARGMRTTLRPNDVPLWSTFARIVASHG